MTDLLVKLYDLDKAVGRLPELVKMEVQIRRGLVPEKSLICSWVRQTFGATWASECEVSFAQQPVACFIAIKSGQLLGFACYNTTFKGFFGPIGVDPRFRSHGIGKTLLISCLDAMAAQGYAYAVIGGISSNNFFDQSVTTFEIPDSTPGAYDGMLKQT